METKELTEQIKSIIKFFLKPWHSDNRQPKFSDQVRSALFKEATKRPRVILKQLERFTAQIEEAVCRTVKAHTLIKKAALNGRVARKTPLLK